MARIRETDPPIHELHRHRWSPRAFSDQPVTKDELRKLLEAARWTPSSNNEQPWIFVVATKDHPDDFNRLLSCLVEKNQSWAKNAAVLMIAVGNKNFTRNGHPNRHAFYDVGQAVASMTFEATALDLYVHQMAGFSHEKAREALDIPESAEAITAIAIGHLGDPASLPDDLRQRELAPSTRKPVSEIAFSGKWGQPGVWTR